MINIALPKGRLGEKAYGLLTEIGYDCKDFLEDNRKLVFQDDSNRVSYFLVKPSDVAIYVERGAADVGFVGKDILLEYNPDVYELMDLNMGKCKMCVAGKGDFDDDVSRPLRVATKFTNIASNYYLSLNREIEIIKLNGSIELAPILNLSDVIVDLVETGSTLRENNLQVLTEIFDISTRLIANKSSYRFKNEEIVDLLQKLGVK
jgi:ATP phosphoribosyltransferase